MNQGSRQIFEKATQATTVAYLRACKQIPNYWLGVGKTTVKHTMSFIANALVIYLPSAADTAPIERMQKAC